MSYFIQTVFNPQYFMLTHTLISKPLIKTKNYIIFNYGVFSTHYKCIFILLLITLTMTARLAETCR